VTAFGYQPDAEAGGARAGPLSPSLGPHRGVPPRGAFRLREEFSTSSTCPTAFRIGPRPRGPSRPGDLGGESSSRRRAGLEPPRDRPRARGPGQAGCCRHPAPSGSAVESHARPDHTNLDAGKSRVRPPPLAQRQKRHLVPLLLHVLHEPPVPVLGVCDRVREPAVSRRVG
jgi:hypothetical protein